MVVLHVYIALRWRARLRGVLGRSPEILDAGLLIAPCRAVHTCFMRRALDVVFLDDKDRVVGCVSGLAPWRFAWKAGTRRVLELRAGRIHELGIGPGARIETVVLNEL